MSARRELSLVLAAALALPAGAGAATITIVNNDGAGEGFNDPTPADPVGGNPGTTLGQQRLALFQFAADVWEALLESEVTILVRANFNPLTCDENGAILGSAGSLSVFANFDPAAQTDTWYGGALADSIEGADLSPGNPDIGATFNSAIDTGCLPGAAGWYYGLDGNVPVDRIGLFSTVLHEIGHGLNFQNFVDEASGSLLGPPTLPDIYTRFTLDNTTGEHWPEMTKNERKASAVNTGNVVWDGTNATTAAPDFLGNLPQLTVNSPGGIAGDYDAAAGSFGGEVGEPGLTADMQVVSDGSAIPSEGCGPLVGFTAGRIAFVDRGNCEFGLKALNAQNAGAVGVVVANNADGDVVFSPGPGADGHLVTIPVIMIGQNDGNAIRPGLPGNATIHLDLDRLAGADSNDHPLLYAPDPVEPGSSGSHWDISAEPNLLMEPFENADVFAQVDLTIPMFRDIGWTAHQYPTSLPDSFVGPIDDPLVVAAPGVLGNDVDNLPPVALSAVLDACCAEDGDVDLEADGSFVYTPPAAFEGTDSFTYHATSAEGASFAVTVTIEVTDDLFADDFESGDTDAWSDAVP